MSNFILGSRDVLAGLMSDKRQTVNLDLANSVPWRNH